MDNSRDHNREEAFQAKKIALEKMQNNDFRHAKETILEAQEICPELADTLSQMLIICDIHCAAESIVGGVTDLYGILKVEETANETLITKQYRKIALSTHPDKNRFPGAQEAFKLVAEAYSVLSDPRKRTEHDSKRNPPFWTQCTHCEYRFQYNKCVLKQEVCCQHCNKMFTAERIEDPASPMRTSSSGTISDSEDPENMSEEQLHDTPSQECHPVKSSSESEEHTSTGGVNLEKTRISETDKNIIGRSMANTADSNVVDQNKVDRKQTSTMPGSGSYSPGSSDRIKQHVDGKISQNNYYGKNRERENDYSCNQISEGSITSGDRQSSQNDDVSSKIDVKELTEGTHTSDDEGNIMEEGIDSVDVEKCYSDPVIKIRDINAITYKYGGIDQIWALYDNIDHMPRSYAKVEGVGRSKCLCLLKFCPFSEEEKEWNNKSLPVACGKFSLGEKVDILKYSSLYSHTVEWKKICLKKVWGRSGFAKTKMMVVYEIYPKRSEVWALYKGWSKLWNSSEADKDRSYDYEVVEVLSDMSDNGGSNVAPLIRIEGFPSLLVAAKDKSGFHIPSSEVSRFSHRIPHYRVSGHENILKKINGPTLEKNQVVPEGFLLLDSSCLPSDLDATFTSMHPDAYMSQSKKTSSKQRQHEIFPQVGEIWAIYVDWAPEQNSSSTDCCAFAVGEITERNDASTKFSFLAKVDGYTTAFRPDKQKGVLEIPTAENQRFSHHIPSSFRVMKEKGGKRRVFYDLDPAYLVTVQDHANSSDNRSTDENQAKQKKTAAAQVGPRRTARLTRPNSHYKGPKWQ